LPFNCLLAKASIIAFYCKHDLVGTGNKNLSQYTVSPIIGGAGVPLCIIISVPVSSLAENMKKNSIARTESVIFTIQRDYLLMTLASGIGFCSISFFAFSCSASLRSRSCISFMRFAILGSFGFG
jgi:hypothetical protein